MSSYSVVDPASGEWHGARPGATAAEIERVLAAADSAARGWGRQSHVAERAALLHEAAELHRSRRGELAAIIRREMAKSSDEALGEADFCADIYDYYAENAEEFLADEVIDVGAGNGSAVVRRQPLGVILGIMPWNFPCYQIARFAAPNLALGNAVVLKPAPQCPESAAVLEQLFAEAGFPAGAYGTAYASDAQAAGIIADERVAGVSLTGSARAGAAVAEIAGRNLKKVVLELGGSDPFIVLSTDELDAVIEKAVAARLENAGQSCNAAKRFIVIDGLYDAFLAGLTAAMSAAAVAPLSSSRAADALVAQLDAAVAAGAVLVGGEREGARVAPGILTRVARDNPVYEQELFGPIAMVFRVASEDEAVELANDTPFGLGSYLFTTDRRQAARVAERIDAGMVYVNGVQLDAAETPFGGVKRSGFGRELGRFGMDEFVNRKLIRIVG